MPANYRKFTCSVCVVSLGAHLLHPRHDPVLTADHLSHTHYELAPHLLHPRHDPVPTADSHRGARVGGASESNLLHTRYDPAFAVAAAAARPPSAVFLRTRYDPAPDTDSHQGARTGGASESHFSTTPSLTTADPSATAASATTTFVASSSPGATEGSADHFSAPAPPTADNTTATGASTTEAPAVAAAAARPSRGSALRRSAPSSPPRVCRWRCCRATARGESVNHRLERDRVLLRRE